MFSILQIFAQTYNVLTWGMDNFKMLISIYKDWLDEAHVGGFPSSMKKFIKMEEALIDENEDVIASFKLFGYE